MLLAIVYSFVFLNGTVSCRHCTESSRQRLGLRNYINTLQSCLFVLWPAFTKTRRVSISGLSVQCKACRCLQYAEKQNSNQVQLTANEDLFQNECTIL